MSEIQFSPQPTPNPNAYKFVAARPIHDGSPLSFYNAESASCHPAAARLFALPGVTGVMILRDFCSVNQNGSQDWAELIPQIQSILVESFSSLRA
jgi:hypothetical protein